MQPQAPTRVPNPPTGQQFITFADETNSKFKLHDNLIYTVLAVVAVALVGLVISTVTLYMDQARFNNQAYMDSTQRTEPEARRLQDKIDSLNKQVDDLHRALDDAKVLSSASK